MFHVITGGSGSGKSSFAEDCIQQYHQDHSKKMLYYIATMEPFGQEMEIKIQRHKKMRAGKGFVTIECYRNLSDVISLDKMIEPDCSVLLECMSNLVGNEFYQQVLDAEKKNIRIDEAIEDRVVDKIWMGVQGLRAICKNLVIVTNEVSSVCDSVSEEMFHYIRILSKINGKMASQADKVTEVVYGIPVELGEKG